MQSCTVPPFFAKPGVLPDGKWAFDGGFSALYAIPPDADPAKIIKVSPWPFFPADVKLHRLSFMELVAAIYPLPIEYQRKLFARGYNMGQTAFDVLCRKGLSPLPEPRGTLQSHLDSFEDVTILSLSRAKRNSRSAQDLQREDFKDGADGMGKLRPGSQSLQNLFDHLKGA